ncbi:RsiV family protein [Prescottella subtropica]|uniref:RsiV family protein n=1 Tax=Prescottella subtropica TaxID=2545757 RepID=UPI0010F926F7|nr:RsiV family protein [Prescottella subtropica]
MRNPRTALVLLAAGSLAFGAGCSSTTDGTPTAHDAPATASASASVSVGTFDEPTSTGVPAVPYTPTSIQVTGDTGRVRYDVLVPQLTGGDPAVTGEFDESMRAALQDQIDGRSGERFTLDSGRGSAVTHIGARVVSGLLITSWNADPPGAHPTPLVATVVIGDDAQPITLDRLFPNLQAGLQRLSEESARLLPSTAAGPDFVRDGIEPRVENFANWVATPAGMELHFTDYQVGPHAAGLIVVTVPWDRLSDVVAPDLLPVVSS